MKRIELEELKQIELDMVKYLDGICKANSIHYYMVGGTLLGAVRHKGFIPWDDDVDVAMPRRDFEKLQKIMEQEQGCYQLQFFNNVKNYGYASPKLVDTRTTLIDYKLGNGMERSSVFIDIFLYDGMGERPRTAMTWYLLLKTFKKMVFLSRRNFKMESTLKTVLFALPWCLCRCVGTDRLNRIYNGLAGKKDFYDSQIVACAAGRYGKGELHPRAVFETTVELPFEDMVLPAPAGYRDYLTGLYHDYMQMPPVEKRVSNHTSEEWWND